MRQRLSRNQVILRQTVADLWTDNLKSSASDSKLMVWQQALADVV